MAELQFIDQLVLGAEPFNQYRLQHPGRSPDLSRTDISEELRKAGRRTESGKLDLRGYNLINLDLSGLWLAGVDLTNAECALAKFKNTNLRKADLTCANCDNADFTGARLDQTVLYKTSLINSDLTGASLEGSRFWKADLFSPSAPSGRLCIGLTNRAAPKDMVDGVPNLLSLINILKQHYSSQGLGESTRFYYRGEASDRWSLTPGVMREPRLREAEEEMLVDVRSRRPEDFAYDTTTIGQMVIAQHHGLPTRLLDVTSNPLVALFHATAATSEPNNGRVHIFALPKDLVRPFNSDTVTILANFAKLRRGEQNVLLGKTTDDTSNDVDPGEVTTQSRNITYTDALNRLNQLIRLENPSFAERIDPRDFLRVFVVEPRRTLERLRAQSGAFLLSAFHDRFEERSIGEWNCDIPRYHHYMLSVPKGAKQQIQEELLTVNITRESLLPGLDETARAIRNRVRGLGGDEEP